MVLIITAAKVTKSKVVNKIRLASACLPSPLRRATKAETATPVAKKRASPTNLGCVVKPTAATALAPRELTIKESTSPASATKKDSTIAGQAILMVV